MAELSPARRQTGLGAAALLLAASVLLSRLLGYLREVALANQLGAGAETDAYYAAFQLPEMLNYFLAGGAFSLAFVPMYARLRDRDGEAAGQRFTEVVLGTTGLVVIVATALLWLTADTLVGWIFGSFDAEKHALAVRLTRIVLPAQIFFVTGGILRGVLMAEGRFAAQAWAPLLYNGFIIAGGIATGTPDGFAWGVLVGAFVGNWLVPVLDLRRSQRVTWRVAPLDPLLLRYVWRALPLMLGLSLLTVDEWYDKLFADELGDGVMAVLGFARRIALAPVAIVGQSVATAALPTLARLYNTGRHDELGRTLGGTLDALIWLSALAAAALAVFHAPVVEILYHHGRFTAEAAAHTSSVLLVMALGIPAWVLQQIGVRAFYAREETWRPMFLGTGVALAAVPLYLALSRRAGAEGLAAAGVIAMSVNAAATLAWARMRHGVPRLLPLWGATLRAAVVAALAALAGLGASSLAVGGGKLGASLTLAWGVPVFGAVALLGARLLAADATWGLIAQAARRISRRTPR